MGDLPLYVAKYKRYTANILVEDNQYYGVVYGISDTITFQATSVDGCKLEFIESIEDYLDWAKEAGFTPQVPLDS